MTRRKVTRNFALRHPRMGGICKRCRCDLVVAKDGRVYCSNTGCMYSKEAIRMGQQVND